MPRKIRWSFGVLAILLAVLFAAAPAQASEPAPDARTAEYEIEFMTDMIDHHMMAVHMSEMCVEKAVHPELVSLCEEMIATQTAEMEMMHMWLMDWYGIDYEHEMHHQHHRMMERMMSMSPEQFEVHFMKMMIRHHRQAVHESAQCLDRAYHPELISLCEEMIATQTAEIEMMQTWLCEWYDMMCED